MAVVKRNQWQSMAVVAVKVAKETPKKSATYSSSNLIFFVCFSVSVTMAKGIGNGFPLAAVVTTPGNEQFNQFHLSESNCSMHE